MFHRHRWLVGWKTLAGWDLFKVVWVCHCGAQKSKRYKL